MAQMETEVSRAARSDRVTISAGVALLAGGEGCDHPISRADAALYEAKDAGRKLVRLAA